jgi:tRNA modification GTPase
MLKDTIAALSTAAAEAAVSVIRVSGPRALEVAAAVLRGRRPLDELSPRTAYRVQALGSGGEVVDEGLVLVFRAPASFTGEDVVEFQGHGGLLVSGSVLAALLAAGARAAGPGEFTQRAYLNGKLDLTQAEAVMDLIHAQSTLALRAANEQLGGAIGREAEALKQDLLPVLAHVEAFIDFPDEDISPETGEALVARLDAVLARTKRLIATSEQGRILRQGARTVICGRPNAGKSSLLNQLSGFERAIVSPTAGTTRDTIEEIVQVHGLPLKLVDTAGLRDSSDAIEQLGIERTRQEMERADLILEVVDASLPPEPGVEVPAGLESRRLRVLNKADLGLAPGWQPGPVDIAVSCQSGAGLDELREAIRQLLLRSGPLQEAHPVVVNARHRVCFERVAERAAEARRILIEGLAPEFVALELREALQALGEVVGAVDVEEVLDVIFASFCIGK